MIAWSRVFLVACGKVGARGRWLRTDASVSLRCGKPMPREVEPLPQGPRVDRGAEPGPSEGRSLGPPPGIWVWASWERLARPSHRCLWSALSLSCRAPGLGSRGRWMSGGSVLSRRRFGNKLSAPRRRLVIIGQRFCRSKVSRKLWLKEEVQSSVHFLSPFLNKRGSHYSCVCVSLVTDSCGGSSH